MKRNGRRKKVFPNMKNGTQSIVKRSKFNQTMKGNGFFVNPEDIKMLNYLDSLKRNPLGADAKGNPLAHEECWDSEIEVVSSCGSCNSVVPLTISQLAMAKINALMVKYPKIEWLAYLLGNDYHIEDIIVPEQTVTTVRVDDIEPVNVPTIGVIHSHHGMGNGFSGVDDAYINQNHDISLCVSHGGINGQVRVNTDCNKYVIVKATVTQVMDGFDVKGFIDDAVTKITEKKFSYGGDNINLNMDLGLGIVDLSDTMKQDIEGALKDDYDVNDLYAYSEIIKTVCIGKDVKQFVSLYDQFLDDDKMSLDGEEINIPIELLDEMDGAFDTLTPPEKSSLIHLNKAIHDLIQKHVNDDFSEDLIKRRINDEFSGNLWDVVGNERS